MSLVYAAALGFAIAIGGLAFYEAQFVSRTGRQVPTPTLMLMVIMEAAFVCALLLAERITL